MPNFFKGLEANIPAIWIDDETIFITTDTGKIYISTGEGKPLKQVGFKTLDKDITYYVDGTTGSDSNDGLTAATSFKTITKAIETLSSTQIVNGNVTINVAAGSYDEIITLQVLYGKGAISLIGAADVSDAANYFVKELNNRLCPSNGIQTIIKGFMTDKYSGWYSQDNSILGTGNSQLASLTSSLPLTPSFSPTKFSYAASTESATKITLKATLTDPSGTLKINGVVTANGVIKSIDLFSGENTIVIETIPSKLGAPSQYILTVEKA